MLNEAKRDQGLTMTGLKQLAGLLLKGGEMWDKYTKWYTTTYPNDLMGSVAYPAAGGLRVVQLINEGPK